MYIYIYKLTGRIVVLLNAIFKQDMILCLCVEKLHYWCILVAVLAGRVALVTSQVEGREQESLWHS